MDTQPSIDFMNEQITKQNEYIAREIQNKLSSDSQINYANEQIAQYETDKVRADERISVHNAEITRINGLISTLQQQ